MDDCEMQREILERLAELEKNADTAEKAKRVAEIYEEAYYTLVEDCKSNEEILSCERSMLNAIKWFKKAYKYGDAMCAIEAADSYLTLAHTGSPEYADEAVKWCMAAKESPDLIHNISEIDRILTEAKQLKQEMADFAEKSKKQKNGGCLKQGLIWCLIIFIACAWFNSCSNNSDTENVEQGEAFSSEKSAQEAAVSPVEADAADFYFLSWQSLYASNNDIELNRFPKEQSILLSKVDSLDDFTYIAADNVLGADRYKITSQPGEYIYSGDVKNNYADGFGALLKISDIYFGVEDSGFGSIEINGKYYNFVYIGDFKEGRFEGYGLKFHEPEDNEYMIFKDLCEDENIPNDEAVAYFLAWLNYVEYDGMFMNGKQEGNGNMYYADLELRSYIPDAVEKVSISNVLYDEISVGSFADGKLNGKCKTYTVGTLLYDGDMKNGKRNGFGYSYNNAGRLEYEGEYKNDMRDGKGILYDYEGNIVYDGEWEMDDYK